MSETRQIEAGDEFQDEHGLTLTVTHVYGGIVRFEVSAKDHSKNMPVDRFTEFIDVHGYERVERNFTDERLVEIMSTLTTGGSCAGCGLSYSGRDHPGRDAYRCLIEYDKGRITEPFNLCADCVDEVKQ